MAPSSTSATKDLSGKTLGGYELLESLGSGGMAQVYLARQKSLARKVAVKVLLPQLAKDANYIVRFRREARAVASLIHANIVQIYEVATANELHFLAQEYVPGCTLRQLVVQRGPLDADQTIAVLRQIAAALGKAGDHGIVHRDIKPENVLLTPTGEVKVADFGLSRYIDPDEGDHSLTAFGMTMGTPHYMSPEQVQGLPLDPRSDLYSCGVTAFFMLVGKPPFDGDSGVEIAVKHVKEKPPSLTGLRPELPLRLVEVVQRLLQKDPSARFQSAHELLAALDRTKTRPVTSWQLPAEPAPAQVTSATRELQTALTQANRSAGRRKARVLWAAGGLLLAAAAGATLAWRTRPPSLLEYDREQVTLVPRKESVREQHVYAVIVNSEQAWRSVAKYYPPEATDENRRFAHQSQHQLGNLYLSQGKFGKAYHCFATLAGLTGVDDRRMRAAGLAGQVLVLRAKGATDHQLADKLASLLPSSDLLPPKLRDQMRQIGRDIRQHVDKPPRRTD